MILTKHLLHPLTKSLFSIHRTDENPYSTSSKVAHHKPSSSPARRRLQLPGSGDPSATGGDPLWSKSEASLHGAAAPPPESPYGTISGVPARNYMQQHQGAGGGGPKGLPEDGGAMRKQESFSRPRYVFQMCIVWLTYLLADFVIRLPDPHFVFPLFPSSIFIFYVYANALSMFVIHVGHS